MTWNEPRGLGIGACALLCFFLAIGDGAAQQAAPSPAPRSSPAPPASSGAAAASETEFVVIIDPAHGGEDKGAVFGPRLLEKDVTLSFARLLRKQLEQHGIAARMLRESDINLPLARRAELSNQQRSSVYVALHAGMPGRTVRVYSALLASDQPSLGRFIPWDSAQSGAVERSAALAKAVAREIQKKDLKALNLAAFLRPLNNIVSPAIAVELSANPSEERSLESQKLQTAVAAALASGITQMRAHWGARP
jgi:N-acetylmuramoyl-L-alanine amidase